MTSFPPAPLLLQQIVSLQYTDAFISYVGYEGTTFHISGPLAPILGAQDGLQMLTISGLHAPFKHLDSQGARQDGTTWYDSVYDPCEIDMVVETSGVTAASSRRIIASWMGAWDPRKLGKMCWFTPERGEWWCNVRLNKNMPDQLTQSHYRSGKQRFTWSMRNDDAFWRSVDCVNTFAGADASGFIALSNMGDQDAWPRYLCYGPGTFTFGDGPTNTVTFGPLGAGQIALITTLPRLRTVVDLSPSAPAQLLNQFQEFISALINFATNNNVPPLLQEFESFFGIQPPQGVLYSLLNGRFTTPIPPMLEQIGPTTVNIPITISNGSSDSKVIAAITPQRRWPE